MPPSHSRGELVQRGLLKRTKVLHVREKIGNEGAQAECERHCKTRERGMRPPAPACRAAWLWAGRVFAGGSWGPV